MTSAFFIDAGRYPVCRDRFTIFVITGAKCSQSSLRSHVGTGSNAHDFVGEDIMIFLTSETDNGSNDVKVAGGVGSSIGRTEVRAVATSWSITSASRFCLILEIFSWKNSLKRFRSSCRSLC